MLLQASRVGHCQRASSISRSQYRLSGLSDSETIQGLQCIGLKQSQSQAGRLHLLEMRKWYSDLQASADKTRKPQIFSAPCRLPAQIFDDLQLLCTRKLQSQTHRNQLP